MGVEQKVELTKEKKMGVIWMVEVKNADEMVKVEWMVDLSDK